MGRRIHACALSGPPRAECCLASESVPGEIYQGSYTDECSGPGALCGDDLSDGKRHYNVQACIRIFAHQWRDGNSKAGPHGCLLLGLCADGVSPGTPLGNDAGAVLADVRDGQELRDPMYSPPNCRRFQFVFLDYNESLISFYIDYLAMTGLFIWIAHYLSMILLRPGRKIPSAKEKAVSERPEAENKIRRK